ncbi:hypothetical protein, partial [Burkholderia ambifaria]|uniref:hypothetical protein n=1 Tax=Burkholderia ambifaria TaxID=152480 RepID=UPI001B926051
MDDRLFWHGAAARIAAVGKTRGRRRRMRGRGWRLARHWKGTGARLVVPRAAWGRRRQAVSVSHDPAPAAAARRRHG